MNKQEKKMSQEELEGLLSFRKRGYFLKNKKGKGSYSRKEKHPNKENLDS